jgi:hypothetical protein
MYCNPPGPSFISIQLPMSTIEHISGRDSGLDSCTNVNESPFVRYILPDKGRQRC